MARPRIEIKKEEFEKLCGLQCTLDEIAGWYKCSEDTIERWCKRTYDKCFADIYKTYSANGKISLRRYQLKLSEKSAAMAIWLGKQWLGQKEKFENEFGEKDNELSITLKIEDLSDGTNGEET